MPTNCDINFDRLDAVYNSGDTINGHIRLHTTKTKSIRGIYIKVSGYAEVEWEERRSRTSNGKTQYYSVYYRAHEQYLNSITYVAGRDCGDSFDLPPGIYEHTFSCLLPRGLPTSCHESYGKIKYEVSVTIDRRLRFDNVFKKPFRVNHMLDLNSSLGLRLPTSLSDSTTVCCLCCCCGGGGEIRAELKIPFTGTTPGQRIPFQLFVYNDSNEDISHCKVKFKKVMTFESQSPSVKYKHISVDLDEKIYTDTVLRLTRKEFKHFIQLPNGLPCTQVGKCIRIEYYIKGKVYMGCCSSDIQIELPVTIGSIPFIEETRDFNDTNVITNQPTAPSVSLTMPENDTLPPVYKTLELPTYDDAIQMLDHSDDEGRSGKNNYKKLINKPESHNTEIPSAPPDYNNSDGFSAASAAASSSTVTTRYGWS